jgi:hypothetical protein
MSSTGKHCLLLGDASSAEFCEVVRWLTAHVALTTSISEAAWCDWIIWLQRYPGEFSSDNVESLRAAAPLADLLLVYGSWCEGELRTGWPMAGVERCPAAAAVARFQTFADFPRRYATHTTADDAAVPLFPQQQTPLKIALAARTASESVALAEALNAAGIRTDEESWRRTTPDAWLIAGDDAGDGFVVAQAEQFHTRWPHCSGWALLNFPRPHERFCLQKYSIQGVFSKPFSLPTFLHALGVELQLLKSFG